MSLITGYSWDFDDGFYSSEKNPDHIFLMAGVYDVVLVRTGLSGETYRSTFRIRVYDYDYTGDNPNASITDKCYRLPVRPGDGYGPSEYKDSENPGFNWVWPAARKGTALGYDENQKEVALVLDTKTQKIYRINRYDIWQDRVGQGDYAEGGLIKSEIHQRAEKAVQGEHIAIVHTETHDYFKPYDNEKRGTAGYDSEGYPVGMRVDQQYHKDGELTPSKITKRVPKDGDIVYPEKLEGRTLQQRITIWHAPWLLTGIRNDYDVIDKAARPSLRQMTESEYQDHLSSLPLFHVSRCFNPLFNRATAVCATGTVDNLITGPDGRDYSAINFSTGNGLSDTLLESLSGDFTLMAWFKDIPTLPVTLWDVGSLSIQIIDGYRLEIDDSTNPVITVDLDWNGLTWMNLGVARNSLRLGVWKNSVNLDNFDLDTIENYGSDFKNILIAEASVFDSIVLPRALNTEEFEYYYDNVLKGGDEVLPEF